MFKVSVPVLSEQRMDMPAISSIADRRATMAPWWERAFEPMARVVLVTISMASGIDATKRTTVYTDESNLVRVRNVP